MKHKIILMFLIFSVFIFPSKIYANTDWDTEKNLKRVNLIGNNLLEKNDLPADIKFLIAEEDHINAYANIKNEVYIYKGLLEFVETEDELVAVIGHEIGHIVNNHVHKQTFLRILINPLSSITQKPLISKIIDSIGFLSLMKVSRKDEYEADLTGVELMIGADYNPLGMISVLNKITGKHFDLISTHPSGDKRVLNVYDYLSYNFPTYVEQPYETDSYKSFSLYLDKILTERRNDPQKMAKYEKKQAELREKRLKKLEEIKTGSSKWVAPVNFLQTIDSFNN